MCIHTAKLYLLCYIEHTGMLFSLMKAKKFFVSLAEHTNKTSLKTKPLKMVMKLCRTKKKKKGLACCFTERETVDVLFAMRLSGW